MYVDDIVLFINPTKHDLDIMDFILKIFSEASGLETNLTKTQYFPINCNDIDMALLQDLGDRSPLSPTPIGVYLCTSRNPAVQLFNL
jgi:hypothetical protein